VVSVLDPVVLLTLAWLLVRPRTGGSYPTAPDDELVTIRPVSDASLTVTVRSTSIQETTIQRMKETIYTLYKLSRDI